MTPVRTADDLMALAHGYQRSMVLFAALRLGVFRLLAPGPAGAGALARRAGADPGRLAVLLDALAALGLLSKRRGLYRNAPLAARLLSGAPGGREGILLHHRDCWDGWTALEAKIREGRKAPRRVPSWHESFIRGMEENARGRAEGVVRRFPLRAGERLLDLGGGPGTYALAWKRRHPGAEVALFDTRETLAVTRRILREKGALGEVRLIAGDFLLDPIDGRWDVVFVSQILHAYCFRDCVRILRKARRALRGGGRVAVQEFVVRADGAGPAGPALFSVHMAAVTGGGKTYSVREIREMLRAAGYVRPAGGRPDGSGVAIVTARAPG